MLRLRRQLVSCAALLFFLALQAACLTNTQSTGSSQVAVKFRLTRPNIQADGNDLTQLNFVAYQRDSQKPIAGATISWLVDGCEAEQIEQKTDEQGSARVSLKASAPGQCTLGAQLSVGEASVTFEQAATLLAYATPAAGLTPGAEFKLRLVVADGAGFTDAGYSGTATLRSSDPLASLPESLTLSAADKGEVSLAVIFRTAGLQTISAYDALTGRMLFSQSFVIGFGAATQLALRELPASTAAGQPLSGTVEVLDDFNNRVRDFTGSVRLACQTELQTDCTPADLPVCAFTASDLGNKACLSLWHLQRQGQNRLQAVLVADPNLQSPAVAVNVLSASQSIVRAVLPTALPAGEAIDLRLQASDAYGNIDTAFTGAVTLQSSDPRASLPARVNFTAADRGLKILPSALTFRSAGSQHVRVVAGSVVVSTAEVQVLLGTTRQVNVRPLSGSASEAFPAPEVALSPAEMQHQVGVVQAVQLWISDAYGNRDRSFAGLVSLSACASPNIIVCPSPVFSIHVNFGPSDLGVKRAVLPMLWQTTGNYSLLARALGHESWRSSQANLQVISGPAVTYSLAGSADPNTLLTVVAGAQVPISLRGFDLYGNLAVGPAQLTLSSSDANASFDVALSFPAGSPVSLELPSIFRTAGSQTLRLQRNANEVDPLASLAINVLPAVASQVDLILPSSAEAGEAVALTLAVKDPYGNLTPSFTGNVLLAASDTLASIPGTPLAPPSYLASNFLYPVVSPASWYRIASSPADAGFKFLPAAVRLRSAGTQQLEARLEGAASGISKAVAVSLGSRRFAYAQPQLPAGSSTAIAGVPVALRFFVGDAYGDVDTAFSGQLVAQALPLPLPVGATLRPSDNGSLTLPAAFTFSRAGTYQLRAEKVGDAALAIAPGFAALTVRPNPQRFAHLSFLNSPQAGALLDAQAWISDAYGNIDRDFVGTLVVQSSDANGLFPPTVSFAPQDNGWKVLPQSFRLTAAGPQTVSLTGSEVGAFNGTFTVAPAAPARTYHAVLGGGYAVNRLVAGFPYDLQLRVEDSYGNAITDQNVTVVLRSSDSNATLAATLSLPANANGVHLIPQGLIMRQAGQHTLSSGLQADALSLTATYEVAAAEQKYAYVRLASPLLIASQPGEVEVFVADAYQNRFRDFTGEIGLLGEGGAQFTGSSLSFDLADAGQKSTTVVFPSSGNFLLSTNPAPGGAVLARSFTAQVQPASAVRYLNLVASGNAQAGQTSTLQLYVTKQAPTNPNLRILDTNFTGSVTLSTSDANGSFFSQPRGQSFTYTFQTSDNGNALLTGALRLRSAGLQSITATSTNPSHSPSTAAAQVSPSSNAFANLNPIGPFQVGQPFSLQVFITDDYGNLATSSPNTSLTLQCSDPNASFPSPIQLTAADQGNKLLPNAVTLYQSGPHTLMLSGSTLNANAAVFTVAPGSIATSTLALSSQTPQTGQAVAFQVGVLDSYGNLVTTANSNLQLAVSDAAATYPSSFTLQNGVYNGTIVFRTTGPQSVSLRLPGSGATLSQVNVAVSLSSSRYAHAAVGYTPSSIQASAEAGALLPLLVWVGDAYGNVDASYSGNITLQSSDALATLPASVTLSPSDAGALILYGTVRFRIAGNVTLTASGAGLPGFPRSFLTTPGSQAFVYAKPITNPNAGAAVSLNAWTADVYGNLITNFIGNANLTSSDPRATLPAAVSFNASSGGNLLLPEVAVFRSAGSQTLTATTAAAAARTQSFQVSLGAARFANAAAYFAGSPFLSPQVALPYDLRVYVADAYDNIDAGFIGNIAVQSSDANVQLVSSGTYSLAAPQAGQLTVSNGVTFGSLGVQTLLARAVGQLAIQPGLATLSVRSGTISRYTMTVSNANAQAGQSISVTITAYDSYNNVAISAPTTALQLVSSDANATLTPSITLNQGYGVFANAATLRTMGPVTLYLQRAGASNTEPPLATASLTVQPGSLAGIQILVPTNTYNGTETYDAAIPVNVLADVVVRLADAYGNILANYGGPIQVSSNPSGLINNSLSQFNYVKNDPNGMRFSRALQFSYPGPGTLLAYDSLAGITATQQLRASILAQLSQGGGFDNAHHCALTFDGRAKCWGRGDSGQLGVGDYQTRGAVALQMAANLPYIALPAGRQAVSAAVAGNHTCLLTDEGAVRCFGQNSSGALGLGDTLTRPAPAASYPTIVGRRATQISLGFYWSCAILDDGSESCWGRNIFGNLGVGDTTNRTTIGAFVRLGTGRIASRIFSGIDSACAVTDQQQSTCWGVNGRGELGLGDTTQRTAPAAVTIALGTGRTVIDGGGGYNGVCSLLDNRNVKCWGENSSGQLGVGDSSNRGTSSSQMGDSLPSVSLGSNRRAIALSYASLNTRGALLDDLTFKMWGSNSTGLLGVGDAITRGTTPGSLGDALPATNVGLGRRIVQATHSDSGCFILDNDTLKCIGASAYGNIGLGDTTTRCTTQRSCGGNLPDVPLLAATAFDPRAVAPYVWLDAADSNTLSLDSSGKVTAWLDRSNGGGNIHVSPAPGATRPTLQSTGFNGLPTVYFNGSSDALASTANMAAFGTNTFSIVAVMKGKENTTSNTLYFMFGGLSSGASIYFWDTQISGGYKRHFAFFGSWHTAQTTWLDALPTLMVANRTANTPSGWEVYLNGNAAFLTLGVDTSNVPNLTAGPLYIGKQNSTTSSWWAQMSLSELIIVWNPCLSTIDRQRLEGYLASKWALTASLPSNHPYKATPPVIN